MANDNIGDKINELLKNPDAINQISSMFSNQGSTPSSNSSPDPEMMTKLASMASKLNDKSDPKLNLLYALKPYMNTSRSQHIDRAIKMIQLTKLTGLFKDL